MYDNNVYNLMMQLVQEHKALWRILNAYKDDAAGDEELDAFWDDLATAKGQQLEELQRLLDARMAVEPAEAEVPAAS